MRLQGPASRLLTVVLGLSLVFGGSRAAGAFMQVPDEPSPESGTAQVVAQGVENIDDRDLRWQIVERTGLPPANAETLTADLGFIIVESGVLLVEDLDSGTQSRLPAGEVILTVAGAEQLRAALGSDASLYREISLVDAAADAAVGGGTVLFAGDAFAGPGARHDLDLLQDSLGAGAQFSVPAGAVPTLVFVRAGAADVATEAGDVFSLGAGEGVSLTGSLLVTAAADGADIAVAYVGPAVPRLARASGTPAAGGRVIEVAGTEATAEAQAARAATPAADAEPSTDDEDGDGLLAAEEAELNTDPALPDTDEDGLTDGVEVVEIGTLPLAADTDGDGVLDGDEVAQGTDPLIAGGAASEPVVEEPATEEAPVESTGPLDSDGDGLEDELEISLGTDPLDLDTDDDDATDGDEYYVLATGTRNPDTDADGVLDGVEAANGTDPNDPSSS